MDQTLSALKAMSWTASLLFKGHFFLKPISSMHNWKPSMTCFNVLLPSTEAPSTLFGSIHLFTPSLMDFERILEAKVLSQTYSKLQNPLGIVPLFPMVLVCVHQPMPQI